MYAMVGVTTRRNGVSNMEFGDRLRMIRKKKGLSLRALASKAGLSASYLSDLERGTRGAPTAPVLERLADALGVSVDALLGRENPSPTPLLDEADVAFANKLREISLEDRLIIERILENAIARQQREEEERRKREGEESGAT